MRCLEALPVHDGGAGLVVLLFGDPHLLEGGQGGQDGATNPYGVLPLWGSDDLDLHRGRSQGCDLLLHTVSDSCKTQTCNIVTGRNFGDTCVNVLSRHF